MLLLTVRLASADTATTDFSTDAGGWIGGTVQDGVLRIADGRAEFGGFDPATVAAVSVTARVRSTSSGGWALAAGGEALSARYDTAGAISLGETRWPLPMAHLTWVPDADPAFEAGADAWEAGGVLHADVVHDEAAGEWRLYYTGFFAPPGYGYRQIVVATSRDGRTWTRLPANPVLTIDYSNDVDGVHVHMPDVIRRPDGTWQMIYACYQNNVGNRLCRATSPDGLAWTPEGVTLDRGAVGEFDSGSLRMPAQWIDDAGLWHLWYDGTDPEQHYGPTGYATSPDGVAWTRHGQILDAAHALQGLDVVRSPWGLEAFYNHDDYFVRASADPADPAAWTEAGTVLTKGWAWWNDGYIQAPTLALDGTTWHMWFNGYTYTDAMERLGHATGVPAPGTWMDVTLTWDGAQLVASVDGAALPAVEQAALGALALTVDGSAELDDVTVTWTTRAEDTGVTDTGDPDTAAPVDTADSGDTGVFDADTDTGADTGAAEAEGCACGRGGGASWAAWGLAALLVGRRRPLLRARTRPRDVG